MVISPGNICRCVLGVGLAQVNKGSGASVQIVQQKIGGVQQKIGVHHIQQLIKQQQQQSEMLLSNWRLINWLPMNYFILRKGPAANDKDWIKSEVINRWWEKLAGIIVGDLWSNPDQIT